MNTDKTVTCPFEEHHFPVLGLLVTGKSVKEISDELNLPYETVKSQVKRMIELSGARKTSELTYFAGKYNWV